MKLISVYGKRIAFCGLVAAATGFSETRGDQLTVETLPFESTLGAEPPSDSVPVVAPPPNPLPKWMQKYVKDMTAGMLVGIALGALIIVIAPIVLLRMRRRKSGAVQPTGAQALNAADSFEGQLASRVASQERLEAEAMNALKLPTAGTKKSEILTKHLKKAVKEDPIGSAQLLRTWMHENET